MGRPRGGQRRASRLEYPTRPARSRLTGRPGSTRGIGSMGHSAIRVADLRRQYPGGGGAGVAVDGRALAVPTGECFGLLGPNGAGRTTPVEIMEGLNRPTSGDVEVLGRRWETDASEIRERIGVSLQETRFPEKSTLR